MRVSDEKTITQWAVQLTSLHRSLPRRNLPQNWISVETTGAEVHGQPAEAFEPQGIHLSRRRVCDEVHSCRSSRTAAHRGMKQLLWALTRAKRIAQHFHSIIFNNESKLSLFRSIFRRIHRSLISATRRKTTSTRESETRSNFFVFFCRRRTGTCSSRWSFCSTKRRKKSRTTRWRRTHSRLSSRHISSAHGNSSLKFCIKPRRRWREWSASW